MSVFMQNTVNNIFSKSLAPCWKLMMLSGDGLRVWRDEGDQLFSISMAKRMGRMDSDGSMRDSGRVQPDAVEKLILQ